jgi:polyketide synthase 5
MGITHVYDSRSTEFAEQIRRDTGGYGVDIVLNSLTGTAQRAGLELLSIGGRFVEIGKFDVYGNTRLELSPFRRNLTFYYVDLALMAESHPRRIGDLLDTVYRRVAEGELAPPEITHYPLRDAATAIRVMSAAEHTGKLVLDITHAGRSNVVVPPQRARRLLHHHWRFGWPRALPRREDGFCKRGCRLWPDRAHLALAADSKGAGDD